MTARVLKSTITQPYRAMDYLANKPSLIILFFLSFLLMPTGAYAVDVLTMLKGFESSLMPLYQLVTAIGYVAGFLLTYSALIQLRRYGEMRTMMASNAELKGPMITMIVGASLIYLPGLMKISLTTLFGSDSILQYPSSGTDWDQAATTLLNIVAFVGVVAIMRGLFHFHRLGGGQAQPGTFTKGLIHIIGGTICLNAYGATQILFTTLGMSS